MKTMNSYSSQAKLMKARQRVKQYSSAVNLFFETFFTKSSFLCVNEKKQNISNWMYYVTYM